MEIRLTIRMDNAAFEGVPGAELARILEEIAAEVQRPYWVLEDTIVPVCDLNGNRVGEFVVVP